jgi:hypothetical protein
VVLFAAHQTIKHCRFAKAVRRWRENVTDEQVLSAFESLKSEMGVTKTISVYQCPCVSSPMLVGIIKPKILLPTTDMTEDKLRFILKHELVHYKRNDLLYKLLVLAATAIHWFNPLIYLSARAISMLCETSCDTEVVRSADADTRQMYSETMIGIAKYQSRLKTALSTNFYGGKKGMKNRISIIMDTGKKRMGAVIMALVLAATLCTGVLIAAAATGNGMPPQSPYIIRVEMPTTQTDASVADFDTRTNRVTFYDAAGNIISYRYLESEEAFWELSAEYGFSQATVTVMEYAQPGLVAIMDEITETVDNTQDPAAGNVAVMESSNDTNAAVPQNRRPSTVVFAEYEEWGLRIEGLYPHPDGGFMATAIQNVFFEGQLIRGFSDFGHGVDMSISSFDRGGNIWVHVIRDEIGNITEFDIEQMENN